MTVEGNVLIINNYLDGQVNSHATSQAVIQSQTDPLLQGIYWMRLQQEQEKGVKCTLIPSDDGIFLLRDATKNPRTIDQKAGASWERAILAADLLRGYRYYCQQHKLGATFFQRSYLEELYAIGNCKTVEEAEKALARFINCLEQELVAEIENGAIEALTNPIEEITALLPWVKLESEPLTIATLQQVDGMAVLQIASPIYELTEQQKQHYQRCALMRDGQASGPDWFRELASHEQQLVIDFRDQILQGRPLSGELPNQLPGIKDASCNRVIMIKPGKQPLICAEVLHCQTGTSNKTISELNQQQREKLCGAINLPKLNVNFSFDKQAPNYIYSPASKDKINAMIKALDALLKNQLKFPSSYFKEHCQLLAAKVTELKALLKTKLTPENAPQLIQLLVEVSELNDILLRELVGVSIPIKSSICQIDCWIASTLRESGMPQVNEIAYTGFERYIRDEHGGSLTPEQASFYQRQFAAAAHFHSVTGMIEELPEMTVPSQQISRDPARSRAKPSFFGPVQQLASKSGFALTVQQLAGSRNWQVKQRGQQTEITFGDNVQVLAKDNLLSTVSSGRHYQELAEMAKAMPEAGVAEIYHEYNDLEELLNIARPLIEQGLQIKLRMDPNYEQVTMEQFLTQLQSEAPGQYQQLLELQGLRTASRML